MTNVTQKSPMEQMDLPVETAVIPSEIPENVSVISTGAWRDKATGRIVKASPGALFNSKTAKEANLRRMEKRASAARREMVEAVRNNGHEDVKGPAQAFARIVGVLTEEVVLNDKVKPAARIAGARFVGQSTNLMDGAKQVFEDGGDGNVISIRLSDAVAKDTMRRLTRSMEKNNV